jgi:hypothetical protein
LPPPRYVQRAEQGPAPPRRGPLQPTSEHQDKDQQSTRHEGPEVWCVPDAETEPAGPCSASADVACTSFEPPPGLDAPANVNGWPVWQLELDPLADEWIAMNEYLDWHCETNFQRYWTNNLLPSRGGHLLRPRSDVYDRTIHRHEAPHSLQSDLTIL